MVATVSARTSARRAKRQLFVEPEPTKRAFTNWTPEEDVRLKAALEVVPALSWIEVAEFVGTRNDSMCRSRARRTERNQAKAPFQDSDTPPTSPLPTPVASVVPSVVSSPIFDVCPPSPLSDSLDAFMLDLPDDLEPPPTGLIAVEELPKEPPPPPNVRIVSISKEAAAQKIIDGPILRLALKAKLEFFNSPGLSLSYADLWKRDPKRAPKAASPMPTKITDYWARKRLRTSASNAHPKQLPVPTPNGPTVGVYLEKAPLELEPVPNYSAADPKTADVMRARANS